jgi:hypothetical protein
VRQPPRLWNSTNASRIRSLKDSFGLENSIQTFKQITTLSLTQIDGRSVTPKSYSFRHNIVSSTIRPTTSRKFVPVSAN